MKFKFNSKSIKIAALSTLAIGGAIAISPQEANAGATVPAQVQEAIDKSIATVNALSPLALAALSIALIPFGSMLALKFLNMVMARI